MPAGQWHFVAVIMTNALVSAGYGFSGYIDGELREMQVWNAEQRVGVLNYVSTTQRIGGSVGYNSTAEIDIGNNSLRIFTNALTKDELDIEYSRVAQPPEDSP